MAKSKGPRTVYVCQICGAQQPRWMGKCPDCGEWNSLVEEKTAAERPAASPRGGMFRLREVAPLAYDEIESQTEARQSSGIEEFDRVLGGGIVPGSLVLIGGEPGIGKSTLLLQAAAHFAERVGPVLYSSGEESEHQIKSRGERLGLERAPLYVLAETCLERILQDISRLRPAFVIVDS